MDVKRINRVIKKVATVIGAVIALAGLLVTSFIVYLYFTNRSFEQTIARNLSVTAEWTEIRPDPPLRMRRDVGELGMTIPNYQDDRGGPIEIKLPDGRIVHPQIELTTARGNVFELEHSGFAFGWEDRIIFTTKGAALPDTTYTDVRIRSDEPFTCDRLFWIERNPK